MRTHLKGTIHDLGDRAMPDSDAAGALILNNPGSRTMRNKFLLYIHYLLYDILVYQPKPTKKNKIIYLYG